MQQKLLQTSVTEKASGAKKSQIWELELGGRVDVRASRYLQTTYD